VPRPRRAVARAAGVLACAAALLPAAAWAQAIPLAPVPPLLPVRADPPPLPAAALPDTAAIPPVDIPMRAVAVAAAMAEWRALATPRAAVREIERRMQRAPLVLDSLATLQGRLVPGQATRRALDDLAGAWVREETQVHEWADVVARRIARLDSMRTDLAVADRRWTNTLARARSEAAPYEVIAIAEGTALDVRSLHTVVEARLRDLVRLESALTRARIAVDAGIRNLEERRAREQRVLLQRTAATATTPVAATVAANAHVWRRAVAAFVEGHRHLASGLGIATVVLALLLLWLRRRARPDDAADPARRRLLQAPIATAVLCSAALVPIGFPLAPAAVLDVAVALTGIALLVTLVPVLGAGSLRFLVPGLALVLLQRAAAALLAGHAVLPLVHLLLAIAQGTLAVSLVRHFAAGGAAARRVSALARWTWRGAWATIVAALAAVAAAVLGYHALAHVLVEGVATLAHLALVSLGLVGALEGLFHLLLLALADDVRVVATHGAALRRGVARALRVAAVLAFGITALVALQLGPATSTLVEELAALPVGIGPARLTIGQIVLCFATVWLGAVVGRWVSIVLEVDVLGRMALPRGAPMTIASLVRYGFVALAFFSGLAAIGVDVRDLAIIGGALSLGVGFGLQTIVNNFVSGLIIAFERPVAVGDVVTLDALEGEVRSIGIRASVVRTWQGAEVVVPNGKLLDRELVNWTRGDGRRRVDITLGLAYGTPVAEAVALLERVAAAEPGVARLPAPAALLAGFGESALDFVLRVWVAVHDVPAVRSGLQVAIERAVREAGWRIPFPQHDVHVVAEASPPVAAPATTLGAAGARPSPPARTPA
jgi:small-conductance mechanosensitive channel